MKVIIKQFLVFSFLLFGILNGMAKATPPAPNSKIADGEPPPPGLPINEHLFLLLILAVIFGIYIVYSRKLNPKTSI
jgi:hypothetical protein